MAIEYKEKMFGVKTKRDRQFEVLDARLIDIQGRLTKIRITQHGQAKTIDNLDGKVDTMSSNIDRIEKEAADAAENVELVKTALDTLNTTVADLKTTVADLQAQVAQGQLDQARLDAAASALEKADEDLDALVLPPAPPVEPPVEG